MGHINEIRVVSPKDLFAGMAYHTRLIASLFAKERHGKCIGDGFSSHSSLACQNICVRYFMIFDGLFKMLFDHIVSKNVLKTCNLTLQHNHLSNLLSKLPSIISHFSV